MSTQPQVTLDNYVDLAGRTEAPIDSQILERFSNVRAIAGLIHLLDTFARVTRQLDHLKKYFFYGKPLPSDFVDIRTLISPEIMLRLQDPKFLRLLHAVLGITTEGGELVSDSHKESLKGILPVIRGQAQIDSVNFLEEGGDIEWYVAQLIRTVAVILGRPVTLQEVLQANIDKLRARYPEKFTTEDAINRNEDAERKILEGSPSPLVDLAYADVLKLKENGWTKDHFAAALKTELSDLMNGQFTPPDKSQTDTGKHDADLVPAEEN